MSDVAMEAKGGFLLCRRFLFMERTEAREGVSDTASTIVSNHRNRNWPTSTRPPAASALSRPGKLHSAPIPAHPVPQS